MVQLKKKLIAVLLTAILSILPNYAFAEEPKPVSEEPKAVSEEPIIKQTQPSAEQEPAPRELLRPLFLRQKLEESVEIYENEFKKEIFKRRLSLDYLPEFEILRRYETMALFPMSRKMESYQISERESRKAQAFLRDSLVASLGEWVDATPWLDEIENSIKKKASYELAIKGKKQIGDEEQFFEIAEQERKEELEKPEKTRAEVVSGILGRRYEIDTGIKPSFSKNYLLGLEAYTRIRNFGPSEFKFYKAEFSINTDQEASFGITKLLSDKWYSQVNISSNLANPYLERASISFVREKKLSLLSPASGRTKLKLQTGWDREKEAFAGFSFAYEF